MQVDYGSASSLASQSAEDLGRESELSTVGQLEERSKNRMDTKNILRYLKPYIYRYTYIIKYIYIYMVPPQKKKRNNIHQISWYLQCLFIFFWYKQLTKTVHFTMATSNKTTNQNNQKDVEESVWFSLKKWKKAGYNQKTILCFWWFAMSTTKYTISNTIIPSVLFLAVC